MMGWGEWIWRSLAYAAAVGIGWVAMALVWDGIVNDQPVWIGAGLLAGLVAGLVWKGATE